MEKKLYFETLRKILTDKVRNFEPKVSVRYDLNLSDMYVVFPPTRQLISYYVLETISYAGGQISVGYYNNHLEVTIHVLYND